LASITFGRAPFLAIAIFDEKTRGERTNSDPATHGQDEANKSERDLAMSQPARYSRASKTEELVNAFMTPRTASVWILLRIDHSQEDPDWSY
jgi:hypothetical protein